jgi:alpha-glucoside transport system permease protein
VRRPPGAWWPWALLAPALILITGWWVAPALASLWRSLVDGGSWVGFEHARFVFTDAGPREAIRNTVVWVVGVAAGSTVAGLALAALADRFRAERWVVPFLVLPTALSLVAVTVMWRLALAFRPAGTDQVGMLNGLLTTAGLDPVAWLTQAPVNTVLLAGILVWVQTGVALLVLVTAIARVPDDVRDAARLDGATEGQIFGRVTVPSIKGAIALAGLSGAAVAIRVFDIVRIGTDGQYRTSVLATEMFDQAFVHNDSGRGATLAVLMLVLMLPIATLAVRRVRRGGPT